MGLTIAAAPESLAEVTTTLLRELNVGGLIAAERQKRLEKVRRLAESAGAPDVRKRARRQVASYEVSGRQGTRKPDEFYAEVAAAYLAGLDMPAVQPTKYVQHQLGASTRTQAAKWVQRARERGLLPPSPGRGRPGVNP